MSSFTLDDIRAAADKKYGPTEIDLGTEKVRLLNPLRLSSEKRKELMAKQEEMSASDTETPDEDAQLNQFRDSLRIVAETPRQAEALIEAIGDDLAVLAEVFSSYVSGEELGEASPSAA